MRIVAPVSKGGGAFIVHQMLQRGVDGYELRPYSPWLSLCPPLIARHCDRRADLAHAPVNYAAFCAAPGQPLVSTFHGFACDAVSRSHASVLQSIHYATDLRWFVQVALRRSAQVTAVSHFLARRVREEFGYSNAIRVIPNGVDADMFTPAGIRGDVRRPLRILFVGNPARHKGADLVPAILDRLRGEFEFVYTAGLARRSRRIDHARAIPLGPVLHTDMPEVYRGADILLAPARREGFGLAIAEAMACGLPVVATDCSAIPELLESNGGGILCPMDNVQAFADALQFLADSPLRRREMGACNRARIEQHFTLGRMLREYRELFTQTLDEGASRRGRK